MNVTLSVGNFPSSKTVQIRVYNLTTTTEVVSWTSTGVSERANGEGKSVYYYTLAVTANSEYIIDWKDNSTPVKTASAPLSILDTGVALAGGQMDLVNAPNSTAIAAIQNGLALASTLTTIDGIVDAIKVVTDRINGLLENSSGDRFTAKALEVAPTGGLTSQEVRDAMKLAPTAGSPAAGSVDKHLDDLAGSGAGDTAVDEDTGGTDNLRYVTSGGAGIDNGIILAYLKTDYDAGDRGSAYVQGSSTTSSTGRWTAPIYLDAGFTYTIAFYKQGVYKVSTKEVTI